VKGWNRDRAIAEAPPTLGGIMTTFLDLSSNQNNSESSKRQLPQRGQESPQPRKNPQKSRTEVIDWLISKGLPPLPVAPPQDPYKYPKTNKKGEIEYSKEKGVPKSLYTGKNPSYLDEKGIPHLINHRQYQKRLPTQAELDVWFANPLNGIGTLGGWLDINWLDLDVKQFESKEKCEAAAVTCIGKIRELTNQQPFIERTHSGGWRIGLQLKKKPNFTNFALTPGGDHVGEALGEGRFTVLAPTKGESGNLYENISRQFPPEIESLESIGIYSTSVTLDQKRVRQSSPSLPLSSATPTTSDIPPIPATPGTLRLEELAFKPARQVLSGDDIKGDRSDSLTGAVKEWIGWENWNFRNNINCVGTSDELAYQAADRLGIDSERCDRILKSITERHTLNPACYKHGGDESCWKKISRLDKPTFKAYCPEVLRERIEAEFRKNAKKTSNPSTASTSSTSSTEEKASDNVVNFPTAPMEFGELRKQMRELMNKSLSTPELKSAQINLRLEYGRISEREFNDLWEKEEEALVKEIEKEETRAEVQEILNLTNEKLKVKDFLPESVAEPIEHWSKSLTTEEAVSLTTILATASSLHKVGTELVVLQKTNFTIPPTIFAAMVAESGQRKSPIFRTLAKQPLDAIQNSKRVGHEEAMQQYRKAVAAYNKTDKSGEPPKEPFLPQHYFTDATSEGIKVQASRSPEKTAFALVDELAGFFNSQNKYRGGRGGDKQELLSYFDGTGTKVVRSNGVTADIDNLYLSIFGTIQPEVLENLMKSGDADGFFARFLWVYQPNVAATLSEDGLVDIVDLMTGLYKKIDRYPKMQYRLSREAFQRFKIFFDASEQTRIMAPKEMQAIYPKMISYVGRFAVNLHVINHAAKTSYETLDGLPSTEITLEEMEAAIKLAKFYIGQAKLSNVNTSPHLDNSANIGRLVNESRRQEKGLTGGWLKAKTFANSFSSKNRPKADVCRSYFREAEGLGYGITRGSGVRLEFKAYSESEMKAAPIGSFQEKASIAFSMKADSLNSEADAIAESISEYSGSVDKLEPQMEPSKVLTDIGLESIASNGTTVICGKQQSDLPDIPYHVPIEIPIEHPDDYPDEPPIDRIPIEKGALCRFIGLMEAAKVLEGYGEITELKEDEDYVVEEVKGEFLRLKKASGELFIENGEESELSNYYRYEIFFQVASVNSNKAYRYVGTEWNLQKVCQHKPLYVVRVEGDRAIVSSPEWGASITNEIPVVDLREVAVQNE